MPILAGSALSVIVCLMATLIPLGKIKRMSIADNIEVIS